MSIICPDCRGDNVIRLRLDMQDPPVYGVWCQDCGRMWTVYEGSPSPERNSTKR